MAINGSFKISDGETSAPLPPVQPPQRLPLPSSENSNGREHSPSIPWPPALDTPAGETIPGPAKPYKSLR
jgi:hypothetical protein